MSATWWARVPQVVRALARRPALRARARWPRSRLEAWQRARVADLVADVSRRSAFYRERWGGTLGAPDVRLAQLPPVRKDELVDALDHAVTDPRLRRAELAAHLERVRGDELYLGRYRVMSSAGSTGRKGVYVYDREEWTSFLAGMFRWTDMMQLAPRLPRPRTAAIGAPDAKHMTFRGAASSDIGVFRSLRLAATQALPELVASLNRHQPEYLNAYPSIAALLAEEQLAGRLRIAPRAVCTSSELRTEDMLRRIRQAWNVEPFDCYGLSETGIAASDCAEHAGLHVYEDLCVLEVVDDAYRPVPAGQVGTRVLVTNLYNRTLPMIRMEVSDLVMMTDEPCACGRTLRRIVSIDGRADDVLTFAATDGAVRRVHPIHLRGPLAAIPELVQYRIAHRPGRLEVDLVVAGGAEAHAVASEVRRALTAALASQHIVVPEVLARCVPHLEREAGAGKLKLVRALT